MLEIGIAAGVLLVLLLWQRKAIKRLASAAGAQVGKLSRWVYGMDPIAIYQAEVDKSAEEIQEAREGLEQFRGHVARLQRQVASGAKKVEDLKGIIKNHLQNGNEDKATSYAIELQSTLVKLEKDKAKLIEQEARYEMNLKKMRLANQKIREAKEKAETLQSDLRLSKADAEMSKLAQNFEIKTSSIDNLSEIEDEIQRQIDANRAKGQVINDLGDDGIDRLDEQENLQKQQARKLLEQFKQELLPAPNIEVKILPPVDQHERN
jgi:phage shock protein A